MSIESRFCIRDPIPEIALAARLLEGAASAHLLGYSELASQLIEMADMNPIRERTESIWGRTSADVHHRAVSESFALLGLSERVKLRMPSLQEKRLLLQRDGHCCRFCGIPVIRAEIRQFLHKCYPKTLKWGRTNASQHAAFQAMWLQYDHVLPHSHGGTNDLDNLVITCAPCNYGRMNRTVNEIGLCDPRHREPVRGSWNGLEAVLNQRGKDARTPHKHEAL